MKIKAEELELVFLVPPPSGECETCGEVDELRPYGPNGEWVCFECAMQDEEAAGEKFEELFSAYNKEGSMKVSKRTEDQLWEFAGYIYDRFRTEGGHLSNYGLYRINYNAGDQVGWAEFTLKMKADPQVTLEVRMSLDPDNKMEGWVKAPLNYGGDSHLERQIDKDEISEESAWYEFSQDVMDEFYDRLEREVPKEGSMDRRGMESYLEEKIEKLKNGEEVVMDDAQLDEAEKSLPDEMLNHLRSIPNPDRVGTKDKYLVWVGGPKEGYPKTSSMSLRAADWKVEMFVGDNVVGTFELEDIVDERAGVEFIIDEHLDWEAYPMGGDRYRVQISVGGREIGEWEVSGADENDAVFNAIDAFVDWDFMEVDSKEGSMRKQAEGLTDADVQEIVDFLNKDTQRHLDYMHDNPDYANNFSDLPKQENYTSMEYGKKIEGLVKKYDMTVEDLVEALEPEDATCEMFWGHTKLDEDESVVFGFYNIDEEELQFDDGMDIELSVGTIGICSALAMLNDNQFARVQKETNEYLPDKAREDAARPSPNFEIYIGIDGYVAVYRDTEDAVKMIEGWAKDQGKTEEEPGE